MLPLIDESNLCCGAAALLATIGLVKQRARASALHTLVVIALVAVALWAAGLSLYSRSPYSAIRAHGLLAGLCLLPMAWLPAALCMGERNWRKLLSSWSALLGGAAVACVLASVTMVVGGVDWITGIMSEPVVVLTHAGLLAVMVAAVPMAAALAVFIWRMRLDMRAVPALWLGAVGEVASFLWISVDILWRGYMTTHVLASVAALSGAASIVTTTALWRGLPVVRPFAPSRRLVYGTLVAALLIGYVTIARFAFGWVTAVASAAAPQLVPVGGFVALSGLALTLGSRRSRHRLWVAVGRHFFRSKHDYGEVWVQLTGLVSTASNASTLIQRAAEFCRDLLFVPEVSIWLGDSSGRVSRAALATADEPAVSFPGDGIRSDTLPDAAQQALVAGDVATYCAAVGAALACPLVVNGRSLGFIAVGPAEQESQLDDEDRRVLAYVAAQLASALGLYHLGEEIADAREISSFHRVAAFVLHDLKNLVAQQSFVIENAGRFRDDPEFVADALAAFEDSTNRMRALIGRLRSRETTESSGPGGCDVVELVRELIAVPHIGRRAGCSVRLTTPPDGRRCLVHVDRVALAQVLSNVLVNAVESLPPEAGEVVVVVAPVAQGWRVEVRDNGRGIPETFLRDHLFRPFRTTKEAGFGIGLYECKTIVEAAGGSIEVQSQVQHGTTVGITLPAFPTDAKRDITGYERPHGQTYSLGY